MHVPLCAVMQSQSLSVPALFMIYYLQLHEVKLKFPRLPSVLGPQGRSQRGVQGVQLNPPPLQINDIHDYCYSLEKLRAEMHIVYNTPTFLCSFNRCLELAIATVLWATI